MHMCRICWLLGVPEFDEALINNIQNTPEKIHEILIATTSMPPAYHWSVNRVEGIASSSVEESIPLCARSRF